MNDAQAYAERLRQMSDDELHAEGFTLVRKRTSAGGPFSRRMVALNDEMRRRDLHTDQHERTASR
jgi:hypothetical protein